MVKYRKKPVVIDAIHFNGILTNGITHFLAGNSFIYQEEKGITLPTLEGEMLVSPGDWIIRGVVGEVYPCKPDIFEMTYEDLHDD